MSTAASFIVGEVEMEDDDKRTLLVAGGAIAGGVICAAILGWVNRYTLMGVQDKFAELQRRQWSANNDLRVEKSKRKQLAKKLRRVRYQIRYGGKAK